MKKKIAAWLIAIAIILCLIPVPMRLKDGGTVVYQAVLYQVTDYHQMREEGILMGTQVDVLGMTLYENTIIAEDIGE